MSQKPELYISVDVETAGPIPGEYSLLSIGACDVDDDSRSFSIQLKPINTKADPIALKVTGLSMEDLAVSGADPATAMAAFAAWATGLASHGQTLVFVGFNAPFDWSFVNYYFHRFAGGNPFGFTALDIKALYMGATRSTWADTRSSQVAKHLAPERRGDHDALHDAKYQAELFRLVRALPRIGVVT
jgi:DNA polymerase III epsilon subunit-like protein